MVPDAQIPIAGGCNNPGQKVLHPLLLLPHTIFGVFPAFPGVLYPLCSLWFLCHLPWTNPILVQAKLAAIFLVGGVDFGYGGPRYNSHLTLEVIRGCTQ